MFLEYFNSGLLTEVFLLLVKVQNPNRTGMNWYGSTVNQFA